MTKRSELNIKNNELGNSLSTENKAIVTDMIVYLRMAPISDIRVEEIRQDILDMALSAQARNEPLVNVFGDDGKVFCDDIIKNIKHRSPWGLVLQWLTAGCGVLTIMGVTDIVFSGYLTQVIKSVHEHTKIDLSYPITLGFIINGILIAVLSFAIVFLIGKHSFTTKEFTRKFDSLKKPNKFFIGCLIGAIVIGYTLLIIQFAKVTLMLVNIIAYCALLLILFLSYIILSKV